MEDEMAEIWRRTELRGKVLPSSMEVRLRSGPTRKEGLQKAFHTAQAHGLETVSSDQRFAVLRTVAPALTCD